MRKDRVRIYGGVYHLQTFLIADFLIQDTKKIIKIISSVFN